MSKTAKYWILGIFAGILIALCLVWLREGCGKKPKEEKVSGPTTPGKEAIGEIQKDGGRLHNKIVKGTIEITGRGSNAKRGYAHEANFKYALFVVFKSEIKEKREEDGKLVVEEIRTFETVSDNLVISDAKLKLAVYETLPVKTFVTIVDTACAVVGVFGAPGSKAVAATVAASTHIADTMLKSIDGAQLSDLWGISPDIGEKELLESIKNVGGDTRAISCIRALSGKSYKITYYLNKEKAPMMMTMTYADGKPVENEEEKMVLQRANIFMDYHIMPDKNAKSWDVNANDMQELFDPFVDGSYRGSVKVTRGADQDGCWNLAMSPSNIAISSEDGQSIGSLTLDEGIALVNPDNYHIKEMRGRGRLNVRKKSKHHLMCTMTISGECEFRGRLVMTDLPK